jgi:thiosulfate/3-mercaptopyruvate sulfurtransferase
MVFTTLISSDELTPHLADPQWVIMDCRFVLAEPAAGERAYRQGHIPGARYAHLERDLSARVAVGSGRHPLPDKERLAATLGAWGISPASQVVVYDDAGGAMAARLWWLLRWMGHSGVAVLDGGWGHWLQEGRAVSPALLPPAQAAFEVRPPLVEWVSSEALQDAMLHQTIQVLDARAAERFRGDVEPIDAVAGHVPGAMNRPLQCNLAADGRFLPAAELRRQFTALLGPIAPQQVVHMCGSGVTACHNLLAMEHAGLSGSRLYAGSWSEWIRDPSRPVAKGAA